MFGWNLNKILKPTPTLDSPRPSADWSFVEKLEDRRMLSASMVHHAITHAVYHATARHAGLKHHPIHDSAGSASSSTSGSSTSSQPVASQDGQIVDTVPFGQAPSAVQSGLTALASKDGLLAPTTTQTVYLGNENGIETYTLSYSSSGTTTRITVDLNGNTVIQPTESSTTWARLNGTGTGSNAAAANEISVIASALGLTAPASTTQINVTTLPDGTSIYTVNLSNTSSSTANWHGHDDGVVRVDSNGNPVGNQQLPFSAIPTAIQNGFNNHLPTGAAALATTSTQIVRVETADGVNLYSTDFTSAGTTTTVTVNSTGALANLPTNATASFSDLPVAAQDELQTLAAADGVTGSIAAGQTVQVYTEANGTIIYSVRLRVTNSSGQAVTLMISVDQSGNPTVPPRDAGIGGCGGEFGGPDSFSGAVGFGGNGDFGSVDFGLASFGGGHF